MSKNGEFLSFQKDVISALGQKVGDGMDLEGVASHYTANHIFGRRVLCCSTSQSVFDWRVIHTNDKPERYFMARPSYESICRKWRLKCAAWTIKLLIVENKTGSQTSKASNYIFI